MTVDDYAKRAANARQHAADCTDAGDRKIYERIATSYEDLVKRGMPKAFNDGRPALPVKPKD